MCEGMAQHGQWHPFVDALATGCAQQFTESSYAAMIRMAAVRLALACQRTLATLPSFFLQPILHVVVERRDAEG